MEECALAIGDIIVGMDIGTSKVSLVIGEVIILIKLKSYAQQVVSVMV